MLFEPHNFQFQAFGCKLGLRFVEFLHHRMVDQFGVRYIDDQVLALDQSDMLDLAFEWDPVAKDSRLARPDLDRIGRDLLDVQIGFEKRFDRNAVDQVNQELESDPCGHSDQKVGS